MKLFEPRFPGKPTGRLGQAMPRRLFLCDIGARGGMQLPWSFLSKNQISLILAEPDPEEAGKLEREYGDDNVTVLPNALWSNESTIGLNLNKSPGTSSVYSANKTFLDQFPDSKRYDMLQKVQVPAITIDQLVARGKIKQIDFMKIDVQGAELEVLQGGRNYLSPNLVGLEVEVEFGELYSGQPLFSEVETFVRKNLGLELWDIRKTFWKYNQGKQFSSPAKGRLVFGDALFFRPLPHIEEWLLQRPDAEIKAKLVMLIVSVITYGYPDYAAALLALPVSGKYLEAPAFDALNMLTRSCGSGFRPFRYGNSRLHTVFDALAKAFQPTHQGWASVERTLGSRRWKNFWL